MNKKSSKNNIEQKDLVFYIKVRFRRNSSMQGTIQWMDGRKSSVFRSALELGNLLSDARRKAQGLSDDEKGFSQWADREGVS